MTKPFAKWNLVCFLKLEGTLARQKLLRKITSRFPLIRKPAGGPVTH